MTADDIMWLHNIFIFRTFVRLGLMSGEDLIALNIYMGTRYTNQREEEIKEYVASASRTP